MSYRFKVRMNNGNIHFTNAVSFAQAINNIKYRLFDKYTVKDIIENCIEQIDLSLLCGTFVLIMHNRRVICINPEDDKRIVYLRDIEYMTVERLVNELPPIDYNAL